MTELMRKLVTDTFGEAFADSPANLAYVEATFCSVDQVLIDEFLGSVDESDFSLRDWVEALREIGHWLDVGGLTMELNDQIGYISCAAASAGPATNLTHLPGLVNEMLQTYGCECAVKK